MAPFVVSAANGCFNGALDVSQHLPAHVADGCAEGVNTIRGGEIVDRLKIVLVEPPGRLKTTAFQQRVGDTDGGGGVRRNSRDPDLWQYNDDLKQPVSEMLSKTYGISGERVSQQLADVAGKLVADYWDNNGGGENSWMARKSSLSNHPAGSKPHRSSSV